MTKADSKGKEVELNGDQPTKVRRKPGRVPVSCAECRRLKLRCDRKVPCETCVKRGCSAICPEGSLTTGNRANKLAFADAEELQKKVERLRTRVKLLEDALRKLQADVSDEPHALLKDSDDNRRQGGSSSPATTSAPAPTLSALQLSTEAENLPPTNPEDEEFIGAFGTLTLGLKGEARFYGSTARPEFLIHAPRYDAWAEVGTTADDFPRLSRTAYDEAAKGYDKPCDVPECKQEVFQLLPSLSEACRLCEIFLDHGDYLWQPIPRSQLYDEILGVIYRSSPHLPEPITPSVASLHALSVLYMAFCLGTVMDPNQPPCSIQAKEYFMLSRLALRCASPMYDITLWTIQSTIYQVAFLQYYAESGSAPHFISHYAWIQLGFAFKLGTSIGLHVKSSKWQLDEEAGQRRANVFWQLVVQDVWLSLNLGRPPSINLSWVDCELPKDPHERVTADGNPEWGFHAWVIQYTQLLHTTLASALAAKVPAYSKVLEMDRKIRDFPVPWSLRAKCGTVEDAPPSKATIMQRYFLMICKEITLLNLHRPYFAQALNEDTTGLLKHRYSPSVLAIYRSAWRLIEALLDTYRRQPFVVQRYGFGWSTALSAGIIMCLLVTRAPTSSFAPASLHELDRLCEIFERCAGPSTPMAAANLDVVRRLQRQAHEAASKMEQDDRSSPALCELDRLGGKTQLLSESTVRPPPPPGSAHCGPSRPRSDVSSSRDTPSSSSSISTPSPFSQPSPPSIAEENMHPIILSDMHTFEGISSSARAPINNFNFDLTQPFPLPIETQFQPDYQTLQEVSGYFGMEYSALGAGATPSVPSMQQQSQHPPPPMDPSPFVTSMPQQPLGPQDISYSGVPLNAPVLDSTWQSFVEQLGF